MNIYELSTGIKQLQDILETEEDSEIIARTLSEYEAKLEDKADAYARVDRNLASQEAGLKEEYDRLKKRAEIIKTNRKRLKLNLQDAMTLTGKKKLKTELFSFTIQKNPPSLKITGKVPERFLIAQEPKVDNTAIKLAMKSGEDIDFAELVQGESLRIR